MAEIERNYAENEKFREIGSEIFVAVAGTNADGSLDVNTIGNGHECLDNSADETLAIDGIFNGDWQDTINYNNIIIGITTTQDSATDGLDIQWSHDGTHVDDNDKFSILANKSKVFTFTPARRYVKIVYTNGGVQSDIDLQTIFKKGGIKASSHRIQDSIVTEDDAELVKAVLTAERDDGTFVNISATDSDNLRVTDAESGLAIAKGDVANTLFVSKFGQNEDIGTGAREDIWDGGGTYTWPADNTAPITHIYSTGVDVQNIEVQGLDINGDQVVQTITLTGTTVAPLTTPLWRVFRMKNQGNVDILVGSIIHASDAGKAVSYAQIQNGNNQTLMALYTIPAGKTGYLVMGGASLVGLNRAYSLDGHFYIRQFGGVFQLKHTFGVTADGTSTFQHEYKIPLPIEEKSDIKVDAISSAAGGILNATFDIVLVDN